MFSAEPEVDPDNFDEKRALEQIISAQKPDGSFGNLINTYFVLPVLGCKSLVNISSSHCKSVRKDGKFNAWLVREMWCKLFINLMKIENSVMY